MPVPEDLFGNATSSPADGTNARDEEQLRAEAGVCRELNELSDTPDVVGEGIY